MLIAVLRLIERLVEPPTLLALLILGGLAALVLRRWRLALSLQIATAAIVIVFGLLPGGTWLALPLERRFPADPALPAHVAGIIALGGTERPTQSAAWHQPIFDDPAPIAALVALGRRYPEARLVFTGGAHTRLAPAVTEARIVRDFLTEIGSDANRVIYEDHSRNTLENALFSRTLVQPRPEETWILVTEAISLPRAVAVFRRAGWNVIPFPAGYLSSGDAGLSTTIDVQGGLRLAAIALHEWGGLIVYRLMGYTDAWFPK
jgi:uncharacterized SAM-binding protein YcdF (DUF218 family)